jgi:Ser/Thr protein kinase RdoA (MazF antagonist)
MDKAEASRVFTPAAEQALSDFPVEPARLELVALSENVTFKVTDARDGADYGLRLHRPGYHTLPELTAERLWTRALAEAGIAVPIGLAATSGDDYVAVPIPALGETRRAGMASWTKGVLLDQALKGETDVGVLTRRFAEIGALEAAMHNQSAAWRPPPAFTRRALDEHGLMGAAPFWGPFWEHPIFGPAERRLVIATRDRLHVALADLGRDPSLYGVIHADLHPGNVLVTETGVAVIDFDDAAFGWHAYDMAVGLFFHRRSPDFDAILAAFLAGYRAVRPLPETVERTIPMFLLVRGLAQIGWLGQRPELEASVYLAENTPWVLEACERCNRGG